MSGRNEVADGMFLIFGMHFVAIAIGGIIGSIASAINLSNIAVLLAIALLGIGIAQLVYVVPMIIWLYRQRKWELMKGVIIGAVITALLNGGCWLLFASIWR